MEFDFCVGSANIFFHQHYTVQILHGVIFTGTTNNIRRLLVAVVKLAHCCIACGGSAGFADFTIPVLLVSPHILPAAGLSAQLVLETVFVSQNVHGCSFVTCTKLLLR